MGQESASYFPALEEAVVVALRAGGARRGASPTTRGSDLRVRDGRRAGFIQRVGDFTAPISADDVYMYVHQTRRNRDNDEELACAVRVGVRVGSPSSG